MNRRKTDRREIDRRCSSRQLPGAASDLCSGSVVLHPVYPCRTRALLLRARDEVHDECRPAVGDLPEDGGGARGGQLQHTDAAQSALLHTQRCPRWTGQSVSGCVVVVVVSDSCSVFDDDDVVVVSGDSYSVVVVLLLLVIVVQCLMMMMMMLLLLVTVASCWCQSLLGSC